MLNKTKGDLILKKTVLNKLHQYLGAKMTDFGGWEMPVEYTSIIEEHQAVRNNCGLFDISHMGELLIKGENAADSVQKIITNNIADLENGEIIYTTICNQAGGIIDDLLVYRLTAEKYLLVVNASNTAKDLKWIQKHLVAGSSVENKTENYALLALQGPKSKQILSELTTVNLDDLSYYNFKKGKIAGEDAIISRTGYTGELGYELYFSPTEAEKIWQQLMKAGSEFGLKACGLGARDTLRLEKRFLLYGSDIDEKRDPFAAGLGWIVDLEKEDFIGREKLIKIKEKCCEKKIAAFKIKGRGIARPGHKIYADDKVVGELTSGSYSPSLKTAIGMGYLKSEYFKKSVELEIKIRNRKVKAELVEGSFV